MYINIISIKYIMFINLNKISYICVIFGDNLHKYHDKYMAKLE